MGKAGHSLWHWDGKACPRNGKEWVSRVEAAARRSTSRVIWGKRGPNTILPLAECVIAAKRGIAPLPSPTCAVQWFLYAFSSSRLSV